MGGVYASVCAPLRGAGGLQLGIVAALLSVVPMVGTAPVTAGAVVPDAGEGGGDLRAGGRAPLERALDLARAGAPCRREGRAT